MNTLKKHVLTVQDSLDENIRNKVPQKYDKIFKSIYANDTGDYHLLETIIAECLEEKVKVIKLIYHELPVGTSGERVKRLDILADLEGKKINIEIDTRHDLVTKVRNVCFFNSFQSNNVRAGDIYDTTTEFIQISLGFGLGLNYPKKLNFKIYDKEHDITYIDTYRIIEVNIDKYAELWYDKNKLEVNKTPLLVSLGLNINELEKYEQSTNKVYVKEVVKKVMDMELNEFNYGLTAEEDAKKMENTRIKLAKEETSQEITQEYEKKFQETKKMHQNEIEEKDKEIEEKEKEIEEKEKELQNQNIEFAKKLLSDNVSVSKIHDYTGLSMNIINELKNN